ncbi:hypothetical protein LJD40_26190, partial [Escherichia coli]|nr:hypothetical protein [Escherichia coli]
LQNAKDKVVGEYFPLISDKLGDAATAVGKALDSANQNVTEYVSETVAPAAEKAASQASSAVAPTLKQGRRAASKARKAAEQAAKEAAAQLKREQKSSGKGGRGWLVFGVFAAAIAAGVAVWRASRPVEDPWKTPVPVNDFAKDV